MATDDDVYAPRPVRRFPVILAVVRSYELMFARASVFARLAMVWVVLCLFALATSIVISLAGEGSSSAVVPFMPALAGFAFMLTSAGVAHAWHRAVLRDQWRAVPLFDVSGLLRYLGVLCGLVGVIVLPMAIINVIVVRTVMDLGTIAIIVAAIVAPIMSAGRLSLVLPAAAIGERLSFVSAWQAMEDNSLRFFGGALLIGVPSAIASWVIRGVVENFLPVGGWAFGAVRIALTILLWFFMVGLATTYLSLAYRFFVQKRDQLESGDMDSLREAFR